MSDIVERIRTFSEYAACEEAADEIERLRARVAELEEERDTWVEVSTRAEEKLAACEKDAARWRYWRSLYDVVTEQADEAEQRIQRAVTPEELDAAIDKAIEGKA
jgi:hypothetical protein